MYNISMSPKRTKLTPARILTATNTMKVLWFMLAHPGEEFYDRQICGLAKMSRAGTNVALRELDAAGLLTRNNRGRMAFYRLRTGDVLIAQLKIVSALAMLNDLIDTLCPLSLRIVLFGSTARGEDTAASDIDLFILTRAPDAIRKVIRASGQEERLKPVIHTPEEWARLRAQNEVFAEQIEKGIVVWDEMLQRTST